MSPTDNTPDFDSMSPEEVMRWLESLAKRQGASEGFTTAADMQVAEVDPNSVVIDEPGYVPYGEDTKKKPAAAEPAKPQPAPMPVPTPQPVVAQLQQAAPPPAPEPAAAAAPDLDSMSPEELMRWMESLAKRQGAYEGFTTSADMQVAEIDPNSVVIDEPGYVPYGEDTKKKPAAAAPARAELQQPAPAAPKPVVPPVAPPVQKPAAAELQPPAPTRSVPEPRRPAPVPPPTPAPLPLPALDLPLPPINEEEAPTELVSPSVDNSMAWLANLAATDQPDVPSLDLSSLTQDFGAPAAQGAAEDPLAWLAGLAQSEPVPPAHVPPPAPLPRAAPSETIMNPLESGIDPMAWLETLAKRQGVPVEELTTGADLEVPDTDDLDLATAGPGYSDYRVETPPEAPVTSGEQPPFSLSPSLAELDDPSAWLDQLATGQPAPTPPAMQEEAAPGAQATAEEFNRIAAGIDNSPEAMIAWMNKQFDRAAKRTDVPLFEEEDEEEVALDLDAPAEPIELPDWLLEAADNPPPLEVEPETKAPLPVLTDELVSPPNVDIPDWLKADVEESANPELETIFAHSDEEDSVSLEGLEIDTSDPWVEAFELERKIEQGELPADWLTTSAPAVPESVPPVRAAAAKPAAAGLPEPQFPDETELVPGQMDSVPDWVDFEAVEQYAEEFAAADEAPLTSEIPAWLLETVADQAAPDEADEALPDWLAAAEIETTEDIPGWLIETVKDDEESQPMIVIVPEPAPLPAPAPPPPPVPAPRPAAVVPQGVRIDTAAVLQSARSKTNEGDLDGSLHDYETIVRANAQLDAVVTDLTTLVQRNAKNPAVYRVMGDALMRQGKLQDALDTYRKALNLL